MRHRRSIVRSSVAVALLVVASLAIASPSSAAPAGWFAEYSAGLSVGGTYTPVVGNFAGTTADDIIWYAPGPATDQLWTANGDGTFTKETLSKQVNGTYTPLVGDFAGDNRDEVFWYGPGTAPDYLWLTSLAGFTQIAKTVSGTYSPFVVPDSQAGGSSEDDIFWYAPGTAGDALWHFAVNGAHTSVPQTMSGTGVPLVGDFDGNFLADIFWYTPGSGADALWRGTNGQGAFTTANFTVNGTYQPVVQDFTEYTDGRSDILFTRAGSGDSLWEGKANGSFAQSSVTIPDAGRPIALRYEWGYTYHYDPAGADQIWYSNGAEPAYSSPCGCTELGSGYTPIVGVFTTTGSPGVFMYKPGSAPEFLFT